MTIDRDVALAPFTTLAIGGRASFFFRAGTVPEAIAALAYAREHGLPLAVLGGGSNLVVPDAGFAGLVLQVAFPQSIVLTAGDTLEVSAGTDWDALVHFACAHDLAGLECLAGIPGLVGAAPIQNIGAYGQEASQTIVGVRVVDRQADPFAEQELPAAECGFAYRRSIFNSTAQGRYLVTSVKFRLAPGAPPSLGYADLAPLRDATPGLLDVYHYVRRVRGAKGMLIDPAHPGPDTRSAGSFFKNPVVPPSVRERIARTLGLPLEQVPGWPAEECIKLPAAWLIERAGFPKGFAVDAQSPVAISIRHTLALTNRSGTASCADLLGLRDLICARVESLFGIVLEQEPVML